MNIMVGLDGRSNDADALALAELLHGALGGRLLLAHVIPPGPPGRGATEYEARKQREGREIMSRAASAFGAPHEARLTGPMAPGPGLCQLAREWQAEILVLASSHRGPVGRIVPGAVASRVLARAPCAIAVAPVGYAHSRPESIAAIGIAYDTTEASDAALERASAAAVRLGAPLVLYHAMSPVPEDPAWDEFRGHMKLFAREIVDSGVRRLPAGVKGIPRVLEGPAAEVIAQAAERDKLDLLFVGSRGYGPLREALVGGVGGRLLQTSSVPLVIIPSGTGPPAAEGPSSPA
jgi:nucleotide-binding universal stress UspA family protein